MGISRSGSQALRVGKASPGDSKTQTCLRSPDCDMRIIPRYINTPDAQVLDQNLCGVGMSQQQFAKLVK